MTVDLQNKPANFTSVYSEAVATEPHPTLARAKVPVLEHLDGTPPLTESLVISEYLEDRWPKMAEESAQQRAAARLFVERFSSALSYMALLRAEERLTLTLTVTLTLTPTLTLTLALTQTLTLTRTRNLSRRARRPRPRRCRPSSQQTLALTLALPLLRGRP